MARPFNSPDLIESMRPQWILMYQSGKSIPKIAKLSNCSQTTVLKHFRAHNIQTRTPFESRGNDEAVKQQWITLYKSGKSLKEIARLSGCVHRTVSEYLRANRIKIRSMSKQRTFDKQKRTAAVDEKRLLDLYDQRKTFHAISQELHISLLRINSVLKKHKKPLIRPRQYPAVDEAGILSIWEQGVKITDIEKQFHISHHRLKRILLKHEKPTRRPWHNRIHGNWKGGKYITAHGYIYIQATDHLHADKRGYMREHRLIMEKHLGRYLDPIEIVHHANENPSDNRLSNLVLCPNHAAHRALHPKKKIRYSLP